MNERTIIYLDDAINLLEELETKRLQGDVGLLYAPMLKGLKALPSALPDYQEVLGWLLAYHTMSFDLHGRYLPHEVISWLINDFAKGFIAERRTDDPD